MRHHGSRPVGLGARASGSGHLTAAVAAYENVRGSHALGQEPDFGRQPRMVAVDGGCDANGDTVHRPSTRLGTIAPMDSSPAPARRHDGVAERARAGACREFRMRARTAPCSPAPRLQTRRAEKDREVGRNPHRIGQTQPMQHGAKQTIVAKFRIRQDTRHRESAGPGLAQQQERLAPFFLKAEGNGNTRLGARGGGEPLGRDIQGGAKEIRAGARPQRGGDGHLTIGNLAQRAGILACHAHRMRPLLRKARAIENQQAFPFGNHRPQATPDGIGAPGRMRNEMLEGLVRAGLGHPREHRFHRFPRAVAQQPLHVPPQGEHLRAMAEAHFEDFEPRAG